MPGLVQIDQKVKASPREHSFLLYISFTHTGRKKHIIIYHCAICIDKSSSKQGES